MEICLENRLHGVNAEGEIKKVCRWLIKHDPEIVEIVQFGSSVYAPEHARDLDLLIFTKTRKDYGVYLDATADIYDKFSVPFNIDVIPCEIGRKIKGSFAVQIRGAYRVLYGSGKHLREATDEAVTEVAERLRGDPTFEEARIHVYGVEGAVNVFMRCREARGERERDSCIRLAFNRLFDAARVASMAYLSTEETRWGRIKRMLSGPHGNKFREIVDTLHIEYFYHGNYPRERPEEEFQRWLRMVEDYIKALESEVKGSPK